MHPPSVDPNDQKKTACYDIDVEVEDPLKSQMRSFLLSTANQQEIASLDNKVGQPPSLSGIPYVTPQSSSCVKYLHDCFPHTSTAEALFSIWSALMRVLAFARGLRLPIGGLVCC